MKNCIHSKTSSAGLRMTRSWYLKTSSTNLRMSEKREKVNYGKEE